MYYVYVLKSKKDHKFYIGYSSNLKRRFHEHQRGLAKSTSARRPFMLLYYEAHTSKPDAQRREKYFKTTKGKSTIRQMLRDALTSNLPII